MEREIPNLDKPILGPLLGFKGPRTVDNYLINIHKFERRVEKKLIHLLGSIDVFASVKSDPYSLPYKEEIIVVLNGESWMNGPYEYKRVFKKIVKEILNKNLSKFRFYFYINIITKTPENAKGFELLSSSFGKIVYCFRYY